MLANRIGGASAGREVGRSVSWRANGANPLRFTPAYPQPW